MDNYFKEYKKAKVLLLDLIEKLEEEKRLDNNESIENITTFNLNNITSKDYICNLLNITDDVLTKEQLLKIKKKILNEKQHNLNYYEEYLKILLGFIYMIEDIYKWKLTPDVRQQVGLELGTDRKTDPKATVYAYFNHGEELGDKIWKILGFSLFVISEESLNKKREEILNELYQYKMKQ